MKLVVSMTLVLIIFANTTSIQAQAPYWGPSIPAMDWRVFYGCGAAMLTVAAIYSLAMGPAGPAFFFSATAAAAVACGGRALIWK